MPPVRSLLVISPHLDDAVLSTWAQLRQADTVHVLVLHSGLPPERTPASGYDLLTGSRNPRRRMEERRVEDSAVMQAHGWRFTHADFLDAPYRSMAIDIVDLSREISTQFGERPDAVLVPASVGGHVDHRATRDAALTALVGREVAVHLYADLPYAAYYGWPHWVTGLQPNPYLDIDAYLNRALHTLEGWTAGPPEIHRLAAEEQHAKEQAMRGYTSQFPAMEGGPSRWLTHPERLPYEVTWPVTRAGN